MSYKSTHNEKKTTLTPLGRYKVLTRLLRYTQSLPPSEAKVAHFIMDRTIGFNNYYESIPYRHFLYGVVRQEDGVQITFPVGLGICTIKKAIRGLESKGLIHRYRTNEMRGTFYYLNYAWECDGIAPMWIIEPEDEDPSFYDRETILPNNKRLKTVPQSTGQKLIRPRPKLSPPRGTKDIPRK